MACQILKIHDLAIQVLAVQDLAIQYLKIQDLAIQDLAIQDFTNVLKIFENHSRFDNSILTESRFGNLRIGNISKVNYGVLGLI